MNRIKTVTLTSSLIVSIGMIVTAVSLVAFAPKSSAEITIVVMLLFVLSPLPIAITLFLLKAMAACSHEEERRTTRDPLTNLYNQPTFWDLLDYETERSRRQDYRFSLLVIDIDNFKAVNDTYGHEAGDAFLVEFAALLKSAIRKGDIAARYGADKYAAILPICDEAQAYTVANRLLESLREFAHSLPDGTQIRETASAGIAVFPDHAKDARDLFLLADNMLEHAKNAGKDRLSLPSSDVDISSLRSAGEKSILIMEAIRERRVVPYFQPITSVSDGSIHAYEVLTRIVLPDRVIAAAEFIESAEGMGAIGKIDYLLIEQTFEKARSGRFSGTLFLNLSPKALILSEFMPTVRRLLRDYGLDPSQMVFEITERDTVKSLATIEKHVRDLKNEGFRFAIDDFGSGYSSFQYIRMFKVDYVKIDGEFVRNMTGSSGMERAIVANIASLASTLGMKTIAEYVETEQIMGEVRSAGVDYAQGFFIKRPSPDLG